MYVCLLRKKRQKAKQVFLYALTKHQHTTRARQHHQVDINPLTLLSVVLEKKSGFPFFSYYFISVEESTLTAGNTSEVSQSSISKQGMLIV